MKEESVVGQYKERVSLLQRTVEDAYTQALFFLFFLFFCCPALWRTRICRCADTCPKKEKEKEKKRRVVAGSMCVLCLSCAVEDACSQVSACAGVCVCVCVCVRVCVCVCKRERERERVCVCVCE